jgi:hypothetical protein
MTQKRQEDTSHSNFVAKNHKSQGTQSWQRMCTLHITLRALPTKLLHFTKCKTLNPKPRDLHLHPTLTLIPNP